MHAVPDRPHDVHADVVHDDRGDAGKIDSKVQSRLRHYAVRRVKPAKQDRDKHLTDDRREDGKHDPQKEVRVDCPLQVLLVLCSKVF